MQHKDADEQSRTMEHQHSSLQSLVLILMLPAPQSVGSCHLATRAACTGCNGPDTLRANSGNMAWPLQPCTFYVAWHLQELYATCLFSGSYQCSSHMTHRYSYACTMHSMHEEQFCT